MIKIIDATKSKVDVTKENGFVRSILTAMTISRKVTVTSNKLRLKVTGICFAVRFRTQINTAFL